jgi:hypothetical protein
MTYIFEGQRSTPRHRSRRSKFGGGCPSPEQKTFILKLRYRHTSSLAQVPSQTDEFRVMGSENNRPPPPLNAGGPYVWPKELFGRNSREPDGLTHACKGCRSVRPQAAAAVAAAAAASPAVAAAAAAVAAATRRAASTLHGIAETRGHMAGSAWRNITRHLCHARGGCTRVGCRGTAAAWARCHVDKAAASLGGAQLP